MQLNGEAQLLHTDKQGDRGYGIQLDQGDRVGLSLQKKSLQANSLQAVNTQGEKDIVNVFCTHYQYPHSDSHRRLCRVSLEPRPKVSLCCFSTGLRLWGPWHALLAQAFLCSLQCSPFYLVQDTAYGCCRPSLLTRTCLQMSSQTCLFSQSLLQVAQKGQFVLSFLPWLRPIFKPIE